MTKHNLYSLLIIQPTKSVKRGCDLFTWEDPPMCMNGRRAMTKFVSRESELNVKVGVLCTRNHHQMCIIVLLIIVVVTHMLKM